MIWLDTVRGKGQKRDRRIERGLLASVGYHFVRWRFNARVRRNFYASLSNQIGAGIAVKPAMETRHRIYSNDGQTPRVAAAIVAKDVVSKIEVDGKGIAAALRPWVSPSEASVIAAGEAAGGDALAGIFQRLVRTIERRSALVSAAWKPMAYGVFVLLVDIGMLVGMVLFALPSLLDLSPVSKMAPGERMFVEFLIFWRDYGLGIGACLAALALFVATTIGRFPRTSAAGRLLEKVPPYTVYRVFQNALFLDNVADLLASDTSQIEALAVMAESNSTWVRVRLLDIRERLMRKGSNFGRALNETPYGFPDRETVYFMADAQGGADFTASVDRFAASEFTQQIERIGAAAKVVNLLLFAISAAWFLFVINGLVGMAAGGFGQIN